MKTSFVQAMQTAAMTMNLLQRRGMESRSAAEYERRLGEAEARTQQETRVHDLKVAGYESRHDNAAELHDLEKHYKTRQVERAEELHDLELRIKQAVLDRGDADLDRRATDTAADRVNKDDIHRLQRQNLIDRGHQEKQRHDLDVEYKKLLIEIRRRAAGFTETLHAQHGDHAAAMHAAAAYAAATATAGMSQQHRAQAEAFEERLVEDTGACGETVANWNSPPVGPVDGQLASDLTVEFTLDSYASHLGDTVLPALGLAQADITDAEIVDLDAPIPDNAGAGIDAAVAASGVLDDVGDDIDPAPAAPTPREHTPEIGGLEQ